MRLFLLIALVFAMGCSSPVRLSPEASLVRSKCGACHPRPDPGPATAAGWERVHGWHQERLHLSDDDVAQIRDYSNGRIRESLLVP